MKPPSAKKTVTKAKHNFVPFELPAATRVRRSVVSDMNVGEIRTIASAKNVVYTALQKVLQQYPKHEYSWDTTTVANSVVVRRDK